METSIRFQKPGAVQVQHPLRIQEGRRWGREVFDAPCLVVAVQKMAAAAEQLVVLVAEKGFVEELRGDVPVLIKNVRLVTVDCSGPPKTRLCLNSKAMLSCCLSLLAVINGMRPERVCVLSREEWSQSKS